MSIQAEKPVQPRGAVVVLFILWLISIVLPWRFSHLFLAILVIPAISLALTLMRYKGLPICVRIMGFLPSVVSCVGLLLFKYRH